MTKIEKHYTSGWMYNHDGDYKGETDIIESFDKSCIRFNKKDKIPKFFHFSQEGIIFKKNYFSIIEITKKTRKPKPKKNTIPTERYNISAKIETMGYNEKLPKELEKIMHLHLIENKNKEFISQK